MKLQFIFILLFFFSAVAFSQSDERVVAQIGNQKITAKEFKLRYELSPYISNKQYLPSDSLKYDFLYSLIAEKLWAAEAERIGISSSDKFKFFFKPLEDMFVRDALFKLEVKDKVKLSTSEIMDGISKYPVTIKAVTIVLPDSNELFNFYSKLISKQNFDSLLQSNPAILNNSEETEIKLGLLKDENLENKVFGLNVNEFSIPERFEQNWVLFYVKDKSFSPIDISDSKTTENIKDIIRNRKIEQRYNEYYAQLLKGFKTDINSEALKIIFEDIWQRIKAKKTENDSVEYFEMSEADFINILTSNNFTQYEKTLFKAGQKEITAKEFLSDLAFNGFYVNQLDSILVIRTLNQKLKDFINNQVITSEGYKRQLHLNSDVMRDLGFWREKYMAQFYFNSSLDSIRLSEEELFSYYQQEMQDKSNRRLINLRILTLSNLDLISDILNQLNEGADFGELIKPFGQTDPLVNILGETGLRPLISLEELASIAANLKLNEVYGPIQRNNAYSLLQLIQREDSSDSIKTDFESIKNNLRSSLRVKKLYEKLNNETVTLAAKNNLKIFPDVIENISTTKIQMFLHRFMGFGGRIAGMPLLTPFSEWINNMNKRNLFP